MKIRKILAAVSLLLTSASSNAGLLTIDIMDKGGLSSSQMSLFDGAKDAWLEILTGVQSAMDISLVIDASGVDMDGQGGVLGRASPTYANVDSDLGFAYATEGVMEFDRADLAVYEQNNQLFDVIFHEIAHVIGFGTLWDTDSFGGVFEGTQSVYRDGSGQYTGQYALAEYRSEFDPNATFVPVELDGGEGTEDSHWDEAWEGGSSEVMTGYLGNTVSLSRTTIASFADIGYTTSVTHPTTSIVQVSTPETMGLMLLALSGLALTGRRRSDKAMQA